MSEDGSLNYSVDAYLVASLEILAVAFLLLFFLYTEGPNGHIASHDPAYEVTMILAETRYASYCSKFVHGHSMFVTQIEQALKHSGTVYQQYLVKTKVSQEEARQYRGPIRGDILLEEIRQVNLQQQQQQQKKIPY